MKKKKLIIYDNNGNPSTEYPVPKFINGGHENKWATRLFSKFRQSAKDRNKVDHWDLKSEEE